MVDNDKSNNFGNDEKEKKKKRFLLILFLIIFLVPIGFGIYALIPERPAPTPVVTYEVQLVNDYDGGLTLSQNTAHKDRTFSADIKIDKSIIRDKLLPDSLSSSDVLCAGEPISYSYKTNTDKFSARITIPSENVKGNITINVQLVTPTETFPITLKANGGKFEGGFVEKTVYAFVGATLNDLEGYSRPDHYREGYHFTHWELESNREQKLYENTPITQEQENATYVANCDLNEIAVTFDPSSGTFPGKTPGQSATLNTLYDTKIKDIDGYANPALENNTFLYYVDGSNKKYTLDDTISIAGEALELKAIYSENLHITLNANGGEFPSGAVTEFDTYKGITLGELEGYAEPTPSIAGQDFTYWIDNNGNKYYRNTVLELAGDVTLIATYKNCEHSITDNFTVIKNQLYGICDKCDAQILIPDNDLVNYSNQFLLYNGSGYEMKDISDMASVVNGAPANSILEMYFIDGEYELGGNRYTPVTCNVHGLYKNDGATYNASINCSQSLGVQTFSGVIFNLEHLVMNGEHRKDAGWYYGLRTPGIICNHCIFEGKQTIYTDDIIFNDCSFDSTNFEDDPDYAIYVYGDYYVEFNRCNFKSDGKAVKVYSEAQDTDTKVKFTDCNFDVRKAISDKAAIQADSEELATKDGRLYIYITRCTENGHIGGLYNDSSIYSYFIVTEK